MTHVIKGRDGVYRSVYVQTLSSDENVQQFVDRMTDFEFEAWYTLWKSSGKRFINSEFQQIPKTPLDKS